MDASPSRRRTATPGAPARPATPAAQAAPPPAGPTYTGLPAHLRTWPRALPTTQETGFADEASWLKEVGGKVSVQTRAAMREGLEDGTLPAVRMGDLQRELVTLSGPAAQRLVLARDPQAAQPDPGPLRAQVFAKVGEDVISVPTRAITRLLDTEEERGLAAQRAIKEALPQLGVPRPTALRLAWLAQPADEPPRVRLVEYRDVDGKVLTPGPREDIEARVARIDRTMPYTLDDLRRDTARKVLSAPSPGARAATAPAAAPATIPATPEGMTPAAERPSSAQTAAPARLAAPTTPAAPHQEDVDQVASPGGAQPTARPTYSSQSFPSAGNRGAPNVELMEASQRIDGSAAPSAGTAHAFVIVASAEKVRQSAKDGLVDFHAGIASNYPQFLAGGAMGGRGRMGPGSKVILAERKGDTLSIVGYMPYAGVRPGTLPAARLLARADQAVPFQKPLDLSMSQLGMPIPNLPFAIAKDDNASAFGMTADIRKNLWNATHRMAGWPME